MISIGEPAPAVHGFIEKPYTNCKWCQNKLDPNQHMMYYCDTACFSAQNKTGGLIQTHYVSIVEEEE